MSKNPVTSEAGGNVLSVGMPATDKPEPVNADLLNIAGQLEKEAAIAPAPTKAEAAANAAAGDLKKTAIAETASLVKAGVALAVGLACKAHPKLLTVWTDKVIDNIAVKAAAVLVKYNIEGGAFMAKYKEEIELAFAIGEPMFASYMLLKLANEERGGVQAMPGPLSSLDEPQTVASEK